MTKTFASLTLKSRAFGCFFVGDLRLQGHTQPSEHSVLGCVWTVSNSNIAIASDLLSLFSGRFPLSANAFLPIQFSVLLWAFALVAGC
jgi:hypothetical protein